MLKNFRELVVWQKAYGLALDVYKATAEFPRDESYGLTSQVRRSAVSIPSNIAEGYGRWYTSDYIRFTRMAYGSLTELQTQLMLSLDLGYMRQEVYEDISKGYEEIERMLASLIKSLERKTNQELRK